MIIIVFRLFKQIYVFVKNVFNKKKIEMSFNIKSIYSNKNIISISIIKLTIVF